MSNPVMIIGVASIGKVAMEIFQSNKVLIYGFLDDNKKLHGTTIDDITVLGKTDEKKYLSILGDKCDVFVAIDDNLLKAGITKNLVKNHGVMPVNAIHKSAIISKTAIIHHGNLINHNTILGAFSEIGNHCILNSGVIIDHEVKLGDYVQIGSGSIISAGVEIGDGAFIGSGVTIVSGVKIGKGARVGAGSVVISDVKDRQTVFGNPAKPIEQ